MSESSVAILVYISYAVQLIILYIIFENILFLDPEERVYNIESINNVKYYILRRGGDSFSMRFRVLGVSNQHVNECSSFVISFKGRNSVQLEIRIDEIVYQKRSSMIWHNHPSPVGKIFHNSQLIDCKNWRNFWIKITKEEVNLGIGLIYDRNILTSIKGEFSTNITQILFRNSIDNIVNKVQITEKGLCLFYIHF